MDLGTDISRASRNLKKPLGAENAVEWFALQARLAAGHSARQAMMRPDSRLGLGRGAFAPWAASGVATEWGAPVINPNDLADRKGDAGKPGAVAAHAPAGGRG